jgi:phosphoribosyl-ATP pyrophosphohydrolase
MNTKPGYHTREIPQGVYGELSKVYEECAELADAEAQGSKLMVLNELADIVGAIEGYLAKHYQNITLVDLIVFSDITKRAFANGRRTPKS